MTTEDDKEERRAVIGLMVMLFMIDMPATPGVSLSKFVKRMRNYK